MKVEKAYFDALSISLITTNLTQMRGEYPKCEFNTKQCSKRENITLERGKEQNKPNLLFYLDLHKCLL